MFSKICAEFSDKFSKRISISETIYFDEHILISVVDKHCIRCVNDRGISDTCCCTDNIEHILTFLFIFFILFAVWRIFCSNSHEWQHERSFQKILTKYEKKFCRRNIECLAANMPE